MKNLTNKNTKIANIKRGGGELNNERYPIEHR